MEALKRATQLAPHILPERAAVLVLRALRVETDSWAQLSDILAERERTSPTSPRYSELQEQYFATRRDTKERLQTFEIPKELYDAASDDGKKDIKGDLWNLNRYISSVKGNREKQELAVFKVNEYYNKNWAVLGANHPKLQWQILCVAGKTGKKEFHPWIATKRGKQSGNTKAINLLAKIYPNMKMPILGIKGA